MSLFRRGFLSGTGHHTEFQLWTENIDNYSHGIETAKIDAVIGVHDGTDFKLAPYTCRQSGELSGFIICGFDKNEIEKLANMLIDFLHEANPKFLKVPPMIKDRKGRINSL